MSLNPAEISKLIKAQIQNIDQDLEMTESGTVISIGDGIATVYGLRNAMMSELLLFPHDVYGMVMNLNRDNVGAVLLGSDNQIEEGDTVIVSAGIANDNLIKGRTNMMRVVMVRWKLLKG